MSNKKVAAIVGAVVGGTLMLGGVGLLTLQQVSALVSSGGYPAIIENLAAKFNLDPVAVEQVFEDTHTQRISDRLTEAVSDGDITEAQKKLILDKMSEFETKVAAINDQELTATERHEAMENLREELKDWADQNDIDMPLLMMGGAMGGRRGGMMDREMGGMMGW